MRKRFETQTDTLTWAASNAGIGVDIPKIGVITEMAMTAELTPSATFDGANQPDGLWRVVQNLRLLGGNSTYFSLPGDAGGQGGTLLHYYNRWNMGPPAGAVAGHISGDVTAPQQAHVPATWWFHPGSRGKNPFDLSAFIPASHESQLRLEWVTGPNTVMDDTVTLTSAVMRISTHFITGKDSEFVAEMQRQGVVTPAFAGGAARGMVPAWQTLTFAPTATAADYSLEHDIPGGGYLRSIWILSQDAIATRPNRADDQVTGVKLIMPDQDPIRVFLDSVVSYQDVGNQLGVDDLPDFGGHAPGGIYPIDLRPFGNEDYGFNLEGVSTAKLGVTISVYASGDDQLILWDKVKPYFGRMGD